MELQSAIPERTKRQETNLSLFFFSTPDGVELYQTAFYIPLLERPLLTVRSKAGLAYRGGSFEWTKGVRALCLIALRAKLSYLKGEPTHYGAVLGVEHSGLYALDGALNNSSLWLHAMFGGDNTGRLFAKRLLLKSGRRGRGGSPLIFSLNDNFIPAGKLSFFVDGKELNTLEELAGLSTQLQEVAR